MIVNKMINLFEEKGYCLIEKPIFKFDGKDCMSSYELSIDEFKQEITKKYSIDEKMIANNSDTISDYHVFYNINTIEMHIINNLSEFVAAITTKKLNQGMTDEDHQHLSNEKYHIYYRGHSDTNYKLEPSIYRENNKSILKNEANIYNDILSSNPHFFSDCTTSIEKLVKMQQHEIPTRLLDLTENPFVALYFACNSEKNKDQHGEVFRFEIPEEKFKYYDSDTVAVLSNLIKCDYDFDASEELDAFDFKRYPVIPDKEDQNDDYWHAIRKFNKSGSIKKLVYFIKNDRSYFLNKIDPHHLQNCTLLVKSKMSIDRMVSQSGAFVLFGIKNRKSDQADINVSYKGYRQKVIIIPSYCKKEIIKELEMFNINQSTVFSDMDNTARYFTSKYI